MSYTTGTTLTAQSQTRDALRQEVQTTIRDAVRAARDASRDAQVEASAAIAGLPAPQATIEALRAELASDQATVAALTSQLADRSMSRRYLALVAGKIADSGAVDAPIGRDPRHRTRMAVVAAGAGRPAATRFRCLARGTIERQAIALIECALGTGRTHQIRVHMKHIGHPLLGDAIYQGPALGITRQALHAWSLGLRDPLDATPRYWHADPPDDLQAAARAGAIDLPAQLLRLRAEPVDRT